MTAVILPIERILNRFAFDKLDSDIAGFLTLLYAGEVVTKLTVAGMLAGVDDDRDHHRYAHEYELLRAEGIGSWGQSLDAILTGPTSQFLAESFRVHQRALAQRSRQSDWQHEAVNLIRDAALVFAPEIEKLPDSVALRQWFHLFSVLRNKTRGHGAPAAHQCTQCIGPLERSIRLVAVRLPLFQEQWAYVRQNYSGKYRVSPLTENTQRFDPLRKQTDAARLSDGVYVYVDDFRPVRLLLSDPDARDFFYPNGQFVQSSFEAISYETGERRRIDAKEFLQPPAPLPVSDTEGRAKLDVVGRVHTNLPPAPVDYVSRPELERRLASALLRERHEIVTLAGPGGIGKTSLALSVLHSVATDEQCRFEAIIWLSARDIDLLSSGPKPVRPHGVSIDDFATTFVQLIEPKERNEKTFKKRPYFANALSQSPIGPFVVVFDNFETVVSPGELYRWIDSVIRSPNKVLITTRTRDFVGDLPIEVSGMSNEEAAALIERTAGALGISRLLTEELRRAIADESGGHPYIMKILLGEIARAGHAIKPARIIASQEQLLTALFERTYGVLTPAAQRIFLLLCGWRSTVPTVGIEAVLMRSAEEPINVRGGIDELKRLSLVEEFASTDSDETLLNVPLAAMAFGKKKLTTSHLQPLVEADARVLQGFGAFQRSAGAAEIRPRVDRLVRDIAKRVSDGGQSVLDYRSMLEFLASRVPATWPEVAQLFVEEGSSEGVRFAIAGLRRYIESGDRTSPPQLVWRRIAELAESVGELKEALHASVSAGLDAVASVDDTSQEAANVSRLLARAKREGSAGLLEERKRLVEPLISRMERSLDRLDPTDLSRLAWLYLNVNNQVRAAELVRRGLESDDENPHCVGLLARGVGK